MNADRPTAIVTGGCAGLGWAMSCRLSADGYHVIAADLAHGELGETSDREISSNIEWRKLDVSDRPAVEACFDDIAATRGIDALVNNAGIQRHSRLEELRWEDWREVVDVNLHGVFNCLQIAGRRMLSAGTGSIVNIASVAARGSAGRAPYAATKAAVIGLTATAGAEWAERGVRVNAIAPGYVDSGVFRQGVAAGTLDLETILARIPAGRLAQPEEIADMVALLISPRASYLNGQTVAVDGGFWVDYGIPLQLA